LGFSILAGWKEGLVSSKKVLSLSDFEWAAAARYITYISAVAGLKEINSNHVISFPLGRIGPDKLLKQKERVLVLLEGNKKCIERFAGEHKQDLGEKELAILRSLYFQYKANIKVVKNHIGAIGECMVAIELQILSSKDGGEDDDLF